MKAYLYLTSIILLCSSCQNNVEKQPPQLPTVKEISTPSKNGGEPNLFVSENKEVYFSWIEYLNDTTDVLLFSKLENQQWTEPIKIAQGSDWFVNWADFPSLVAYQDGGQSLAAHWLQKSAKGVYDYDVHIAQSRDGGNTWGESFIIHRDSIAAEHGFTTLIPLTNNRIFATWLDGRNTKDASTSEDEHGHGHGGAMTLRTAEFDIDGQLFEEVELDNRICDCCQTDAAMTAGGMVVVYRDRSEHEIRDISIVRKINGEWSKPNTVHADNWEIAGCPVNGPVVDAIESTVAVAWFTAAQAKPSVKISFSKDSGQTFSAPIKVDNDNPLGRVDVVLLSEKEALVSWLENSEDNAVIKAVRVNSEGMIGESFLVANSSPSRESGFPILEKSGDRLFLAWTHVDSLTTIRTAELILK